MVKSQYRVGPDDLTVMIMNSTVFWVTTFCILGRTRRFRTSRRLPFHGRRVRLPINHNKRGQELKNKHISSDFNFVNYYLPPQVNTIYLSPKRTPNALNKFRNSRSSYIHRQRLRWCWGEIKSVQWRGIPAIHPITHTQQWRSATRLVRPISCIYIHIQLRRVRTNSMFWKKK